MTKMTKTQLQARNREIMDKLDELDLKAKRENRKFTDEENMEYDTLMREHVLNREKLAGMVNAAELAKMRESIDKSVQLREYIKGVKEGRENATTILQNIVNTGADQNTTANLEAGGLIPVEIRPIIDTKVPGTELPEDLVMVTGVTGTQVIPYSINDVKFTVEGEVTKVEEQALDFANITTSPKRVAASVPVSRRAVANAAFDIVAFITYKFQKGWAQFRALHIYAHGAYTQLQSPFAQVTAEKLTLDENIGKNLAKKIAEMYDLGFEGDP